MATIDEVVTTTIAIQDAAVTQEGFGTPLIAAYHTLWPERVRTFSEPGDLLLPPYSLAATHPIYLAAKQLKSQKPSPAQFKIGKRLGAATQILTVTVVASPAPVQGDVYSFVINGTTITVTAGASPTPTTVATALAAAMSGVTGITTTSSTGTVTLTSSTAGARHRLEQQTSNLTVKETTVEPTPNLATDLAAIRAYDSDWYGLLLDSQASAEVQAAAAWAETQRILFMPTLRDSEVKDGAVTTDVGSALKNASYQRTIPIYHERPATQYPGAAWMGLMFPKAPGSANYANMALAGVDQMRLSDSERAALKAKNVNYYVPIKGVGFTLDGRASGGRYADITHGMDWFEVRTQERIVALLANNDKVPYTDSGMELIRGQIAAQILEGIDAGVIDGAQAWSVTVPKVATANPTDKVNRLVSGVKFTFVLQGAVNKVGINGTVLIAP